MKKIKKNKSLWNDISDFEVGDKIISFSKIIYKVEKIVEAVIGLNKEAYSLIINIETGRKTEATHFKNYCFELYNSEKDK